VAIVHHGQVTRVEDGFNDSGERVMIGRLWIQLRRHIEVRDETSRLPYHERPFALAQHRILHVCNAVTAQDHSYPPKEVEVYDPWDLCVSFQQTFGGLAR
jgi:hypothetical protein